jgi:hypothetical protein
MVLTVATALSAPVATADSPDWNYLEGGYIKTEVDSSGDLDGWEVAGSWNFRDRLYVRGSYARQDEDFDAILQDLELDILSLGGGFIWSLQDSTDLYGELSYEHWRVELGGFDGEDFDEDDNGYRAAVGGRAVVWRGLELNAELGLIDVGDVIDSESYFRLGAVYTFGTGVGIGASYQEIDDLEIVRFTLRYAFR